MLKGFLKQPKVIEFCVRRVMNGSNHDGCTKFDICIPSPEGIFFRQDRSFISIFGPIGRFSPQICERIYRHPRKFMARP